MGQGVGWAPHFNTYITHVMGLGRHVPEPTPGYSVVRVCVRVRQQVRGKKNTVGEGEKRAKCVRTRARKGNVCARVRAGSKRQCA